MSEIIPLPTGGTAIIAGEWARNPIVEIIPLPSGGTAIIAGEWGSVRWHVGIAWGSPGWHIS